MNRLKLPATFSERFNHILFTLVISLVILPCFAQQMTRGISIEMVHAKTAKSVPQADDQNAVVIVINDKGSIFDGIEPVSAEALVSHLKKHPPSGGDVYVKADARADYKHVLAVLEALSESGIDTPVLLTAQPEPLRANGRISPTGLPVQLRGIPRQRQVAIQLQHVGKRQVARIDGKDVLQPDWQSVLRDTLRGDKSVLVTAGDDVSYADLIGLIDSARAAGTQAVILKHP